MSPDQPHHPGEPQLAISDGAHLGNPHFFFLPPMVAEPNATGVASLRRRPVIQIEEGMLDSNGVWTGVPFRTFAWSGGAINIVDQHYQLDWDTGLETIDHSKTYRIRILGRELSATTGDLELGYADVQFASTGGEAKNLMASLSPSGSARGAGAWPGA